MLEAYLSNGSYEPCGNSDSKIQKINAIYFYFTSKSCNKLVIIY